MGNLLSASANTNVQRSLNQVYQSSSQTCTATCENIQSGITVFLDGSSTGDISFTQSCTANASCMMTQSLQSVAEQLQTLKQGNQTEANLFGGGFNIGTVNLNQSNQEIVNQVTQIMNAACSAESINVQNDVLVFARNSKTGNISFTQTGSANADCVMQNSATAIAKLQNDAKQSNANVAGGLGGMLGLIIVAIIIVAVIGAVSKAQKKGGGPPGLGGMMGGGEQAAGAGGSQTGAKSGAQNTTAGGASGSAGGGTSSGGGSFNFQQLASMYGGGKGGGGMGRK